MKLTPSSTTRRSVAMACSRLGGSPQTPGPVIRIAPKPRRLTVRSPPTSMVPAAAAVGCALTPYLLMPTGSQNAHGQLLMISPRGRSGGETADGSAVRGGPHDDLADAGLHGQVGLEVPRQAGRRGGDPGRRLLAHRDRPERHPVDVAHINAFQAKLILSRLGFTGDPDKQV